MRGIIHRLFHARQRQLAIGPQQGEPVQRLRQCQKVAFVAVAQELTGGLIQLQIVLLCSRGNPFWQMRLLWSLAGDKHRTGVSRVNRAAFSCAFVSLLPRTISSRSPCNKLTSIASCSLMAALDHSQAAGSGLSDERQTGSWPDKARR